MGAYQFVEVPVIGDADVMLKTMNESPAIAELRATGHRAAFMVGLSDDGKKAIIAYEAPARGDFMHLLFTVPLLIAGVFVTLVISGVIQ